MKRLIKQSIVTLRDYFFAGLLIWLPLGITVWIISFVIGALDDLALLLPAAWQPNQMIGRYIPGLGALEAVLLILMTGLFAKNVLGGKIVAWFDWVISRMPFVKGIYNSVKKVSDTLLSDGGNAFREAVLVPFPQPNLWTIGFITGSPAEAIVPHLDEAYISVYVPTTPNPTGGYFILVKKSDIRPLAMSVDEALKYVISMGVVAPAMNASIAANLGHINATNTHTPPNDSV